MMNHVERRTLIVKLDLEKSMLKSSLCYYRNAYIIVSATITVPDTATEGANPNKRKNLIINICAPFTICISEINNAEIDNPKDIDMVMPVYNLIEYSDNYSKMSGSLWQHYTDEPSLNANGDIVIFVLIIIAVLCLNQNKNSMVSRK